MVYDTRFDSSAEESASASEQMDALANQMKGMVDRLVTLVGGKLDKDGRADAEEADDQANQAIAHPRIEQGRTNQADDEVYLDY